MTTGDDGDGGDTIGGGNDLGSGGGATDLNEIVDGIDID